MADDEQQRTERSLSLTSSGVTLLGVLVSIGVTVGMGISGAWWLRTAMGLGVSLLLVLVVKAGTRRGRGPLARLAGWAVDGGRDDG